MKNMSEKSRVLNSLHTKEDGFDDAMHSRICSEIFGDMKNNTNDQN